MRQPEGFAHGRDGGECCLLSTSPSAPVENNCSQTGVESAFLSRYLQTAGTCLLAKAVHLGDNKSLAIEEQFAGVLSVALRSFRVIGAPAVCAVNLGS